jgi:hypothetical protein
LIAARSELCWTVSELPLALIEAEPATTLPPLGNWLGPIPPAKPGPETRFAQAAMPSISAARWRLGD